VQRESPLSIPQAFDPNVSTPSAQNRACRGGRAGCKILPGAGDTPATTTAFSLVELLVVITIIIVLAGLVLSTMGYVRKKGARARAETEIATMSAALESYKADNGIYPRGPAAATTIGSVTIPANVTDSLDPRTNGDPTGTTSPTYSQASLYLYTQLSGDLTGNRQPSGKSYLSFKPNMLSPTDQTQLVASIRDPFGNSYGYSTANQAVAANGYNPTFDLWSTSGLTTTPPTNTITPQWIKNW
jgi:general secretion pathway protein G